MIAMMVYMLCGATSILCAGALYRQFTRTHSRLLLWSCLCFVGLALNNCGLFIDAVIIPDIDLSITRTVPALAGVSVLLFGFIWDSL